MALKKSQLYSSLWQSCDELRGGMDASQYKDYILTLLFMKYISDKYAGDADALIVVPEGGGFSDMVALKGNVEIGDKINKIISKFAEANDLKGVVDQADFNDENKLGRGKEMQDRLSKLVAIFEGLDFSMNRAHGDDLLGDAYEYLMRNFATESGKSKGQFYTPAEVSRIMAKVVGIGPGTRQDQAIYDPTCGSGSLLIRAADEAPKGITIYGQEMDNATWSLAKMNTLLHGHPTAELWQGNTLAEPYFKNSDNSLKTFDFAVANPPFSDKAWSTGLNPANDEYRRFGFGVPPPRNGDYAYMLHLIASLKSNGKGAIVMPHGVLFRGNKEADIRRNLINRGLIKGIIGLPANLFYGTGIPACIVVIDKEGAKDRTGVFMIDASAGFVKDGNKNRLRAQDIHKIVDVFNSQTELAGYSRMVPKTEIANSANDYNLNIPRYIDPSEPEDVHDLDAHLNGGIPDRDIDALDGYWGVFPTLRETLFGPNGRDGYSEAKVEAAQVRAAILGHDEFASYRQQSDDLFDAWCKNHEPYLKGINTDSVPRTVIDTLSVDLLDRFGDLPLVEPHDVYQRLMDYWDEVMQDDVYLISADGWKKAAAPRGIIEDKERKITEVSDLTIKPNKYKMDLIPPRLIIVRYFATAKAAVHELTANHEMTTSNLETFVEEHTGDDGHLVDMIGDKGKVTKSRLNARIKVLAGDDDPGSDEERRVLKQCLAFIDSEAKASKAVKEAQDRLDRMVLARYGSLTVAEIKALVVGDKWLADIQAEVQRESRQLTQRLSGRVQELEERYADPLPALEKEVAKFSLIVQAQLRKLGLALDPA